jgi:hypothetical protein
MLGFFDAHCRTQFRIVFFSLFKFIVMLVPSVLILRYRLCHTYFSNSGQVFLVFQLPNKKYYHFHPGYSFIDALPF